ncbi:MAG: hypothetical protein ACT4PP_09780 [Sporichthyaceae bacterium]
MSKDAGPGADERLDPDDLISAADLARIRARLAEPVTPLDEQARERMLAAALDDAEQGDPDKNVTGSPEPA